MLLITDEELDSVCEKVIKERDGIDMRDLQEVEKCSVKRMRKSLVVDFSEVVRSGWTKEEIKQFRK